MRASAAVISQRGRVVPGSPRTIPATAIGFLLTCLGRCCSSAVVESSALARECKLYLQERQLFAHEPEGERRRLLKECLVLLRQRRILLLRADQVRTQGAFGGRDRRGILVVVTIVIGGGGGGGCGGGGDGGATTTTTTATTRSFQGSHSRT